MFLLRLAKVDFNQIFNQGFRVMLLTVSVVCYSLLVTFHVFMLRPLFKICGKSYFSLVSRWLFSNPINDPIAATHSEIAVVCYLTNVQDMTIMSFGLLFIAMFMCECCLIRRKKRQLNALLARRQNGKGTDARVAVSTLGSIGDGEEGKPDAKIIRQRLSKKSSTTRFIGRLALLIPSAFLSTAHLVCAITTYLLFHLVLPSLDADTRKANGSYLEAIKWRTLIYAILSFFLCGFYWSMAGINMSMLQAIYARSRRQDQFRRMNASVFTEGNTIA